MQLLDYLSSFLTDDKKKLFKKILSLRTRYITIALEDIYQSRNASAVLRTCDCFGIQDVHIIENENEYELNPNVSMGASKWLNIHRINQLENNSLKAISELRKKAYRIIATTPHTDNVNLEDFDIGKGKFALFMGNEKEGLSNTILNNADEFLKIPMLGFTESFNISVSASIILHHLSLKLRQSDIDWHLSDEEKSTIELDWTKKSIKKVALIEKYFNENIK